MESPVAIDFDEIDDWSPTLTAILYSYVSKAATQKLSKSAPQYIEDAQELLFELTKRDEIIDAVLAWLRSTEIVGYHGSRLTDAEVVSIQTEGLRPLKAGARRNRLIRALSKHPKWPDVFSQLDLAIQAHGPDGRAGTRENQVHLTLSKAGLVQSFNHYLVFGSEFDQHVAYSLLGEEGIELLAHYGKSRIIKLAVPGNFALTAAHPIFSIDDIRSNGEVPNLVKEFIKSWSFRLAYPMFQSRTLKVDCGMVFRETIPSTWITGIETINISHDQ